MTTTIKRTLKAQPRNNKAIAKYGFNFLDIEGTFLHVPLSKIDLSPLNYRETIDEDEILGLAKSLKPYGVISPVTVRKKANGRFELVVGERRYRAAKIGQLKSIPALVKILTDEQVNEIMLLENLQRKDPHPIHEAQAIAKMQKSGNTIDEICIRLGKSKTFIYTRLKWAELILPIQKMFLGNKISIKDVTAMSLLEGSSQQEFFDKHCTNWEEKNFAFSHVSHAISRYKYDLKNADFDTKDKNLIPDAGSCTRCPFNSATIKSLFPEFAKVAVCSHKVCYQAKTLKNLENGFRKILAEHQPTAILRSGNFSNESQMLIDSIPELNILPEVDYNDVNVIEPPCQPEKEDYEDYQTGELEEEDYNGALITYETDLAEYNLVITSENLLKGLTVKNNVISLVYYNPEKKITVGTAVTAKEVQQAIKDGKATPELLDKEIERIEAREKRAKQIDLDNIQKQVHATFKECLKAEDYKPILTLTDLTAARLLIFQSLDWNIRSYIVEKLFSGIDTFHPSKLLQALSELTESQFAFLIRMVFCGRSTSSSPNLIDGKCLYDIAYASGFDIKTIEAENKKLADKREDSVNGRIAELKRKIEKLKPQD
ncbi:ParB/RepB/Spo0J family partition protein [Sphingobacterium detergens]|uniref:ParB/RepB/Spo0J family partition protein n=1 Tax=Sphingobacterium detergens TaxID=1145106 RepID=A0A420ARX7_SPHD1|nr:ParB/RepB/Spo0J family partition protein [Sphingobacterium detergens]RKE47143.1 ParB/RepB/Spo0J family partition protein [Sphingobacterium detergens]